jgi:hypothetical protein
VRNGQLIVATAIGVYASRGKNGGKYAPLGDELPSVAVYQISLKPGDPDTLVAATYGRGVWTYKFANRGAGCTDRIAPKTRFAKRSLKAARRLGGRRLTVRGKVTDRGCGKNRRGKVKRVRISISRQVSQTRRGGTKCRNLKANGRFARRGSCHKHRYLRARGTKTWRFTSKRRVPAGIYRIRVKSVDAAGNRERLHKKTNTRRIRVR